jgi:hypothetical protein
MGGAEAYMFCLENSLVVIPDDDHGDVGLTKDDTLSRNTFL